MPNKALLAAARLEVVVALSCSQLFYLLPSTFGVPELGVSPII